MIWEDLKVLLAIDREGSLTAAAKYLGMDQSTVSRKLSALEGDLGTILFVRSRSGLALTDAGKTARHHAKMIEATANSLAEDVTDVSGGSVGLVRLLGNAWTLEQLTAQAMPAFLQQNPNLEMRLISLSPRLRTHGHASVSLWFEVEPCEGEFAIPLGQVPYALYRARNAPPDIKDWVIFFDEDAARPAITKAANRLRLPDENLRLTATDASTIRAAVATGIGKGLLPMCIAEQDQRLLRVNSGAPELTRTLNMHIHADTAETRKVRATVAWLREAFPRVFSGSGDAA